MIFTSGSTGPSKGVVLTSRTLLDIVLENTLTEEGFRPGTVTLLVLPLAFTPGLVYGLLITHHAGRHTHRRARTESVARGAADRKASVCERFRGAIDL